MRSQLEDELRNIMEYPNDMRLDWWCFLFFYVFLVSISVGFSENTTFPPISTIPTNLFIHFFICWEVQSILEAALPKFGFIEDFHAFNLAKYNQILRSRCVASCTLCMTRIHDGMFICFEMSTISYCTELYFRSELLAKYITFFKPQSHWRLAISVYISVSNCCPI